MSELCFNVWYYLKPDQTILALAAKAYLLGGEEGEMSGVLQSLSRHDYNTVPVYELPSGVKMGYPNGVPYEALQDLGIDVVFEDAFKPTVQTLHEGVHIPEDKLVFATPLFDFGKGFVPAEIRDGFIKSRDLPDG